MRGPQGGRDLLEVEIHRNRVDVDQDGPQARESDDVRGRGERVGGDEHLVAGLEPEREDRQVERGGPRGDRDGVLHAARSGEQTLELVDLRAHRQLARLEHGLDLGQLLLAHVRASEADHAAAGFRLRYHAIVRERPSSSSTSASKSSSSRALSTFGIRSSTSV